ncbi:response regulator [Actinoplanes sp. N902-109]|uniref:response regulator n=1 Tax=Actinoplanes sp. (strain N902-109) TaxID=649831 RepID=UPI00039E0EE6|nr:response regulator [Actinoplanes sp. N902-109]
MPLHVTPDFTVRLLVGTVVLNGTKGQRELTRRAAAATAYLANPPRRQRHSLSIGQALWETPPQLNSVHKIIGEVRSRGVTIRESGGLYTLDVAPELVDSEYFIQQTEDVAGLMNDPERLDALLGLWHLDPATVHSEYLARDFWQRLDYARDRVISAMADADSDFRDRLRNLGEFRQACSGRPKVGRLKPRKRLLLVDDLDADTIASFLGSDDYEYQKVRSGRAFWELADNGKMRFDGAIVDRCLAEGTPDESGYDVLKYLLAKHPEIPRILISAQLTGAQGQRIRELDLFEAFGKLAGGGLGGLSDSVARMVNGTVQR